MRIDAYTKVVLTIIGVMLTAIACKPLVSPEASRADGPLAGVQIAHRPRGDFDTSRYWTPRPVMFGYMTGTSKLSAMKPC